MKTIMKLVLSIVLSCTFYFAQTQDLHIYYDVHQDSMWYMKNGKPVEDLSVRKGKKVYFHLVEFNNYIYSAEFNALQHALPPAGIGGDSSRLQSFLPGLLSGFFPSGHQPFLNIPIFGSLMGAVSGLGGLGNARGDKEELVTFKQLLNDLEKEQSSLNALVEDLNKRTKAITILKGNAEFVNTLCRSSSVAPKLIKQLVLDYFKEALLLEDGQSFEVKNVDELQEKLMQVPVMASHANERLLAYKNKVLEINRYVSVLKSSDHGIDELYPLIKQYENEMPNVNETLNRYEQSISRKFAESTNGQSLDLGASIRSFYIKYVEISSNDFSFTHQAKAESRYLVYKMQLFRKDSLYNLNPSAEELTPVKTISVEIETYGEFSLGSSMGINVGKHGKTPQKYFVKNNVIEAEAEDVVAPVLSSFINVAYSISPSFTPAISFGVGLPLKSSENTESLTFFLGPSMTLGRSKSVMFSAGLMFSKITQLSNGLQIGQSVQIGDGVLPTQKRYDTGFYLGIGYNLGR